MTVSGGARLGTRRITKVDVRGVANALDKHKLSALVLISGLDGYEECLHLQKHANEFPSNSVAYNANCISFQENSPGADSSKHFEQPPWD
jgi:hypothetical protein